MYPVSQEFLDKIKADERQVFAKLQVDYTDPFLDQSIEVITSENANVSFPSQTADAVAEPFAKIASLDGSWVLDGTYALAPTPQEAETKQMGWWGKQLAGTGGAFSTPYPTLTVTFFSRPITKLQAVGDSKREEWPVDFAIRLYDGNNTLLHTETVTGNTQIAWSKILAEPVTQVEKMTLEITKWSHEGRQAKILEFFTSIQEIYEGDDIILVHLLEEREVSQGSLPVGNISANEIDIRLFNSNRKFDAGNKQSPLYQTLKANRRIKAWLGVDTAEGKEYVPLGTFWSGDWHVPEDGVYAATTGRDRLELLRKSTYSTSKVLPEIKALPQPTFTRSSEAHLSDGTKVSANVPRFEDGKFGKGVLIEEGTTNLLTINQSTVEENTSGFSSYRNAVLSKDTSEFWEGSASLKVVTPGTQSSEGVLITIPGSYNPGDILSASIHIKGSGYIRFYMGDNQIGMSSRSYMTLDNTWRTLTVTYALRGTYPIRPFIGILTNITQNAVFYIDGLQVEQKPYPTSFTDSTRANEVLTVPTEGVLNPQEGTIECWWTPINQPSNTIISQSTSPPILQVGNYYANNSWVLWAWGGLKFYARGDNASGWTYSGTIIDNLDWYSLDTPVHFAIKWSNGNTFEIFMNGIKYGTCISSTFFTGIAGNYISLGCKNASSGKTNAIYDDIRISSIARTDEEIKAAYESGKPLAWDEDTTYLLRFDGNLNTAQQTATLHGLAKTVLTDAGLAEEEYFIDTELKQFPVPYAWFEPQSHREALRKIAEACLGQVYCDRNGIIRIEGPSFLQSQTEPVATITPGDYFRKDNPVKWSEIANYIEVETQPLRPDVSQEVYRSNEPVSITAGQTKTITAYYNHTPCIEATATLENAVSGAQITKATYYAWGANITVTSTNTGTFELVINAKPLKVLNKEKAIAKDDASITDNGMLKYTFPANPLVQTREVAQKIADTLLAYFKNPRRDVEIEWRGNPALLLGDRIAVIDKDETNEYYVTRQELEFDGALWARMSGRRAT